MRRMSIQQFRATLAGGSRPGTLACAYRELAHRPELATGMRALDWVTWPSTTSAQASA